MSIVLAASTALMFSLGTYLLLQRRLSRLIIGLGLLGHGANLLLLLSGGRRGVAGIVGSTDGKVIADELAKHGAAGVPLMFAVNVTATRAPPVTCRSDTFT